MQINHIWIGVVIAVLLMPNSLLGVIELLRIFARFAS